MMFCCCADDSTNRMGSEMVSASASPTQMADGPQQVDAPLMDQYQSGSVSVKDEVPPLQVMGVEDSQPTAAANTQPGEMVIGFELPDGSSKNVTFTRRPLGLDFQKNQAPIKLKEVRSGSHGAELGVQEGWTVVSINKIDIRDKDFAFTFDRLVKGSMSLNPPA